MATRPPDDHQSITTSSPAKPPVAVTRSGACMVDGAECGLKPASALKKRLHDKDDNWTGLGNFQVHVSSYQMSWAANLQENKYLPQLVYALSTTRLLL